MHSSRMRTGRSLTVSRSLLPRGGVYLVPGGVWFWGGVWSRGEVPAWGVSAPGEGEVCLLLRQTPHRGQNHRCL